MPAAIVALAILGWTGADAEDSSRTPVLVELFTSEGCPNCPAAESLLHRIHHDQPYPGVRVLLLSEHVESWNTETWRDPFSASEFTRRQTWYSMRWPVRLYTPQVVIDGRVESLGSDAGRIEEAVRATTRQPKAPGAIRARRVSPERVALTIVFAQRRGTEAADVWLAVVEDDLRGTTSLPHIAVARRLEKIGGVEADVAEFGTNIFLEIDKDWRPDRLRFIAFLQERSSRAVVGAAEAALP